MREIMGECHLSLGLPATWHRGHFLIDGVWVMSGIYPHLSMILARGKKMGGHHALMVDFPKYDVFGKHLIHILQPEARR